MLALWCPLATPTVLLGFLSPWTQGISSRLLQQSTASAPYLGWGVSPHGCPSWPWTWSSSSQPSCACAAAAPWAWGCSSQLPPLTSDMGYSLHRFKNQKLTLTAFLWRQKLFSPIDGNLRQTSGKWIVRVLHQTANWSEVGTEISLLLWHCWFQGMAKLHLQDISKHNTDMYIFFKEKKFFYVILVLYYSNSIVRETFGVLPILTLLESICRKISNDTW